MHYYEKLTDGIVIPQHYVKMTSRPDELRPTRITDIRKMWKENREVCPSVTTVLNVLDKRALTNWKIDQHIETCFQHEPIGGFDKDSYINEIKRITELRLDQAPKAGTDFHKLMQDYLEDRFEGTKDEADLCGRVIEVVDKECGTNSKSILHIEENFVSHGYGGQIDLRINDEWVIDYKTKQLASKFKPGKMAYPDHSRQLAAYSNAVAPNAKCVNIFVCLENGDIDFHIHTEDQLKNGLAVFKNALNIWQIENKL